MKDQLFQEARRAGQAAHSPYSGKKVGAALRLANGKVYSGANIENASFGATVCAERVAVWKAMSENPGAKVSEIAIHTDADAPWPPCGLCRQVLAEFADPTLKVHVANEKGIQKTYLFSELFPEAFSPHFLKS